MSIWADQTPIELLEESFAKAASTLESKVDSDDFVEDIKYSMKYINGDAKARIHSVTGKLAGAIETTVKVSADAPTEIEAGISYTRHRGARHAHLVEGGHGGKHPAKPHPFWEPAVEAHGEDAVDALEREISHIEDAVIAEIIS